MKKRIEKATEELSFIDQFDLVIVNDALEDALKEAEKIIRDHI